jgi:type VI secretion system protein ImpM
MTSPRAVVFGKLPTHGDFVARGLTDCTRRAWDDYLSAGLERARSRAGLDFERVHDRAPPWRFVAGPGAFGPAWRAGALAPSIDAAGRRFFIMLGIDDLDAGLATACGQGLAEAMEDSIHLAFAHALDVDALTAVAERHRVACRDTAPVGDPEARERWWIEPAPGVVATQLDIAPQDLIGDAGLNTGQWD